MAETIMKLKDKKGDNGKFVGHADTAPAAADLLTFLTGKTYAGCAEYSTVTPGTPAAPKAVVATDVLNNDIDVKCVIVYKDISTPSNPATRKLIIPAPIINAIGGICIVETNDMKQVPAIPPSGGVGDGGNTIMTAWETALGASAGDFQFISGGLIKVKR